MVRRRADGHSLCACAKWCVFMGVSAGAGVRWRGVPQNMAVLSAQSYAQGSVLLLEILCCVEGGLRNLWKKSQNEGSFRSVRTSDDVENCFRVKISTSYE